METLPRLIIVPSCMRHESRQLRHNKQSFQQQTVFEKPVASDIVTGVKPGLVTSYDLQAWKQSGHIFKEVNK